MPCALVLSAGGMFGAYQAGVWNVLSRSLKPDMIVGTSAGALNGWAIAGGCSAADLTAMWLDPATALLMKPRFPWIPWNGIFDPDALRRQVNDWYERFKPLVPYSLTVVQLPRLRLVRVPQEQVTPRHLLASCAVPFGYPPVWIDGKLYVDGGLLDPLPLWAAAEMGATSAIAVNALPLMPSRVLRGAVSVARRIGQKPAQTAGMDVTRISARGPLGSVRDAIVWNQGNVRRWIQQGEDDAQAAILKTR